ncbi:MAG: beta-lactamase-like protein [Benjaminiella poitrasii]|nr:MAG: beta-lactamase-like protein [Benjaminiella poitrasii]
MTEDNDRKRKDIIELERSKATLQQFYLHKKTILSDKSNVQQRTMTLDCPTCNETLVDLTMTELDSHINTCLLEILNDDLDIQDMPPHHRQPSLAVPRHKGVGDTTLVVDCFSYGEIANCTGYLLSHFHSDHYRGLDANWTHGPIYCSDITARLLQTKLGVLEDFVYPLPINLPCPLSPSVSVTLIDANHCPGSVMFLVTTTGHHGQQRRYLHTGDFRACPRMYELLEGVGVDVMYLDTTYLDPQYSFPSQESCVSAACGIAERHIQGLLPQQQEEHYNEGRLLVVVGTYTLGKERLFIEIAKRLDSKIFVTDEKRKILDCFGDRELEGMLTDQANEAQVHVIPLWHIVPESLVAYFNSLQPMFTEMVAFKPTGWTFHDSETPSTIMVSLETIIKTRPAEMTSNMLKTSFANAQIKIYEVPYSEHSSFQELASFVAKIDVCSIVPTVYVKGNNQYLLEEWLRDKEKQDKVQK